MSEVSAAIEQEAAETAGAVAEVVVDGMTAELRETLDNLSTRVDECLTRLTTLEQRSAETPASQEVTVIVATPEPEAPEPEAPEAPETPEAEVITPDGAAVIPETANATSAPSAEPAGAVEVPAAQPESPRSSRGMLGSLMLGRRRRAS